MSFIDCENKERNIEKMSLSEIEFRLNKYISISALAMQNFGSVVSIDVFADALEKRQICQNKVGKLFEEIRRRIER